MKNRCIILGSGASISEGIDKGLWDYLSKEVVLSCNYNYSIRNPKRCPEPTANVFFDAKFYVWNKEEIDTWPLVFAPYENQVVKVCKDSNVWILPANKVDSMICTGKEAWDVGFFKGHFVQNFATSIAIALGFNEIYLLGANFCSIGSHTHYYGELDHPDLQMKNLLNRGVGKQFQKNKQKWVYKTGDYNNLENLKWWKPFSTIKDIKIYNVSPNSLIPYFPKINYNEFFEILNKEPYNINQHEEREKIKKFVLEKFNATNKI